VSGGNCFTRQAWLFNFRKYIGAVKVSERQWVPIGTTTNEQLHRELNSLFDNVHNIYRPVLLLRLFIFGLYKLLPHCRVVSTPTVRQVSQQMVLSRIVPTLRPWSEQEWQALCASGMDAHGRTRIAPLPSSAERKVLKKRVQCWRALKGVAKRRPAPTVRKRTAFTKVTGLLAALKSRASRAKAQRRRGTA